MLIPGLAGLTDGKIATVIATVAVRGRRVTGTSEAHSATTGRVVPGPRAFVATGLLNAGGKSPAK